MDTVMRVQPRCNSDPSVVTEKEIDLVHRLLFCDLDGDRYDFSLDNVIVTDTIDRVIVTTSIDDDDDEFLLAFRENHLEQPRRNLPTVYEYSLCVWSSSQEMISSWSATIRASQCAGPRVQDINLDSPVGRYIRSPKTALPMTPRRSPRAVLGKEGSYGQATNFLAEHKHSAVEKSSLLI